MPEPIFVVKFYPPSPSWDDASIVAARYEYQHDSRTNIYGKIYYEPDGRFSCSCSDYKSNGRCGHAAAWESLS